jgi:hypothetical protein
VKKAMAAILLILLFVAQVGYYFIYTTQQYFIKEELEQRMLGKIPRSSVDLITAEQVADKIVWKEKGKEFSLDGVMYDVMRVEKKHGKTLIYCINDTKEKRLLDQLVNAVNGNHNPNERNTVKSPLTELFCVNNDEAPIFVSEPSTYIEYNEVVVSSLEEIVIQPPRA